ncbi:phosphatase PAP2 family protein [Taklimakanibacter deserti]|uniref:phosphatase PAP2 family protein n=1 Tax=Taklimakanibacter deserti TaxID=2267839 RepID=UPI000E658027
MRNLRSILVFHPALWGLVVLQSLVIVAWIAIDPRISFSLTRVFDPAITLGVCLLVAATAYGFQASRWPVIAERTRVMATGILFLVLSFTGVRFLNYLSMSLALPWADNMLDSWDRMFGIDWHAYASWLSQYPDILPYLEQCYILAAVSIPFIFMVLVALGRAERAKEFATLLYIGVFVTVCIAGFFPAEGAMVRYMDSQLPAGTFGPKGGVFFVEALRTVRESKEVVLSFAALPGLASFPSFHTVISLLIVYACRDNIVTLLLAAVGAGAILVATPVYGGHYFIDVVAGILLAVVLAAAYAAVKNANLSAPTFVVTHSTR